MELRNPYIGIIAICLIIILSHHFNWISKKSNIPNVLLLVLLGILMRLGLDYFKIGILDYLNDILVYIGTIGLIMIVLEAALELELTREKIPLMLKSFFLALFSMVACISFITWLIYVLLIDDLTSALMYAVPISVVSSAIVIASAGKLAKKNRELLIYESSFSDILGILVFFYLVNSLGRNSVSDIAAHISVNLIATIVLAVAIGSLMLIILVKIRSQVNLFLLVAVLVLLYSAGKLMNISSLLMIFIFGLIVINSHVFFPGRLIGLFKQESLAKVRDDFHILTMESVFFARTFFFVIFGITMPPESLADIKSIAVSIIIVLGIFMIRYIFLKIVSVKKPFPVLFISPRGLITILLFFSIPSGYHNDEFNPAILLYIMILTNVAMAVSLMFRSEYREYTESLNFDDWDELDREIDSLSRNK